MYVILAIYIYTSYIHKYIQRERERERERESEREITRTRQRKREREMQRYREREREKTIQVVYMSLWLKHATRMPHDNEVGLILQLSLSLLNVRPNDQH